MSLKEIIIGTDSKMIYNVALKIVSHKTLWR